MRANWLIAMAVAILIPAAAGAADAPPTRSEAPSSPAKSTDYRCPTTAYLNCMPPVSEDRRASCTKDYVAWVQRNCPKTQVVY